MGLGDLYNRILDALGSYDLCRNLFGLLRYNMVFLLHRHGNQRCPPGYLPISASDVLPLVELQSHARGESIQLEGSGIRWTK